MVLETNNLTKKYGRITAIADVELKVEANTVFGLLGPNGAGKTTTMKLMLGLARPTFGEVRVLGQTMTMNTVGLKRDIGYLPQNPRFLPHMTVDQVMEYVSSLANLRQNADTNELLRLVGLQDKKQRVVKNLSGGERQRLGIAQALVGDPKLVILDEPAAALDPLGRKAVLEIISNLKKVSTVIFSTHILEDVQRVSDQVAILKDGKLVTQGEVSVMLEGANTDNVYLLELVGSAKKIGKRLQKLPVVESVSRLTSSAGDRLQLVLKDDPLSVQKVLAFLATQKAVRVEKFMRSANDLESLFIQLVEENASDQ